MVVGDGCVDQESSIHLFLRRIFSPKFFLNWQVCHKVPGPNHTHLPECVRGLPEVKVKLPTW